MYCRKCKSEITQDNNLCPYCGTEQSYFKANPYERALKIFALIFAIGFGFGSFLDILYSLYCLAVLSLPASIFLTIFCVFSAICGLWMTLVLILIAFRRTEDNTSSLTFGLIIGGVVTSAFRILSAQLLITNITSTINLFWFIFFGSYFLISAIVSFFNVVICISVVYFLLYKIRQVSKFMSLFKEPSKKFSLILGLAKSILSKNNTNPSSGTKSKDEHEANSSS